MLGLGGASAAVAGLGFKTALKADEPFEAKGTLWKTHDFADGVVRMKKDDLLPELWAKEALTILEEHVQAAKLAHFERELQYEPTGRVVTLSVQGDYDKAHNQSVGMFGRKPRLGEQVTFKGSDSVYTVIARDGDKRKWQVLLDRPLECAVADRTPVYECGTHNLMRSSGRDNVGRILIEQGSKSIELAGDVHITYTSHYEPIMETYWDGRTAIRQGDEQPLDLTVNATVDWAKPDFDVIQLLRSGEQSPWDDDPCEPASFRLTAFGLEGESYVFEKCYLTSTYQDMHSATLSIQACCMKAEEYRA